jgi:predicted aspartyl protease
MGKVAVTAKIENWHDLCNVEGGLLPKEQVRRIEVIVALVDTSASTLALPRRFIAQLGLQRFRSRRVRTSAGLILSDMYGVVCLTIQGREWHGDVVEVPDDAPVLIGQLPLWGLDFVVDPVGQRLIGNPAQGGEHVIELY